jgi:hypothetical protein
LDQNELQPVAQRWQAGFPDSPDRGGCYLRLISVARDYIAGQEEHHRKISFQDEFKKLLKSYEIEFDERYVWD